MSKKRFLLCIFVFSCLLYYQSVKAIEEQIVIINEIAWMGNTISANDEWIELLNTTNKNIDLSGWFLKSANNKLKVPLKGQIIANSFYLLERTDDNSVPEIKADLIYKGALSNNGADLFLYDDSDNTIDRAMYSSGWLNGDNTSKQTMERVNINNWQTSKELNGTPRQNNSSGAIKNIIQSKPSLPESKKIDNKDSEDVLLATINTNEPIGNNPSTIFLISLLIILVSSGIILFLKLKK